MPRLRLPSFRSRGASTQKSGGGAKTALLAGGIGGALGSLLGSAGSILGGSKSGTIPQTNVVKGNFGKGYSNSGKANYGPLPSFSTSTPQAKRYTAPTLSTVSDQIADLLVVSNLIYGTLKDQLELEKFQYREKARIQKELNAESLRGVDSSGMSSLGGAGSLNTALAGLLGALGAVANDLDKAANDNGLGIPPVLPIPGGSGGAVKPGAAKPGAARVTPSGRPFVTKAEALTKSGKIRKGYEAVINSKTGATAGYRKVAESVGKPGLFSKLWGETKDLAGKATSVAKSSAAGRAIGYAGSYAKKGLGKLAFPVTAAMEAWDAWEQIQALPPTLTPEQKNKEITKIVSKLVASIGLVWAGATLGALAGSVFPGPGNFVGFVGGLGGGLLASYTLGDDVDTIVENLIDKAAPVSQPKLSDMAPRPAQKKEEASTQQVKSQPIAATKKNGRTVSQQIEDGAKKVGVDPTILVSIAKEANPELNLNADLGSLNKNIMSLTTDQWNQIIQKYGSQYKELKAGMNNTLASITAGALLVKDAQEFLASNGLDSNLGSIYSSYLVGNKGLTDLLAADQSAFARDVTPQAANERPSLFTSGGQPLTVADFLSNTMNIQPTESGSSGGQTGNPPNVELASIQRQINQMASMAATMATAPFGGRGPSSMNVFNDSGSATGVPPSDASAPQASPETPPATPVPMEGASEKTEGIITASNDIEAAEVAPPTVVVPPKTSGAQPVLPSTVTGYIGTGNVPDPTFDLGDLRSQLFHGASVW